MARKKINTGRNYPSIFSSMSTYGCLPSPGHHKGTRSPQSQDLAMSPGSTPHRPSHGEKSHTVSRLLLSSFNRWHKHKPELKTATLVQENNTGLMRRRTNLDFPDGFHLHRVIVQHPQYGLQHPDVVPVFLDELLQLLDSVLLLYESESAEGVQDF